MCCGGGIVFVLVNVASSIHGLRDYYFNLRFQHVVRNIEKTDSSRDVPNKKVIIKNCGTIPVPKPFNVDKKPVPDYV
jgi:hypothetical protein